MKKKPLAFILKRQKSRIKNPIKKRVRILRHKASTFGFVVYYVQQLCVPSSEKYPFILVYHGIKRVIIARGTLPQIEAEVDRYWKLKIFS